VKAKQQLMRELAFITETPVKRTKEQTQLSETTCLLKDPAAVASARKGTE
jgi:5-bromo-4-chloroindolyl phosphate hydrolysis protein